jgi:cation:H+ antiporter
LWLSAVIRPLPFSSLNNIDILMTIVISVLLFLGLFVGKKNVLQKREWIIFVLLYIAYIVFLVITQW